MNKKIKKYKNQIRKTEETNNNMIFSVRKKSVPSTDEDEDE